MTDLVRVLLVDDEIRNLEALEAVLEPSGCQLVRAQSAEEALLHLLDHDFAAIVLDIKMPGMSGLELAELIKQRKRTRHVPILFLTAHLLDEQDVLRGYRVGAVDYLTKPLNPEILRSKIAGFVDLYRKTRALAAANDSLQREIHDRERAEEALYAANQQLEARVEERTTELRFAHDVLRASEERLRLALDAGRMGTWEVDHVSRLSRFDEVESALLGLEPGVRTLTVEQFYALVHAEDLPRLRGAVEAPHVGGLGAPNGGGAFEIEFRVVRPMDGAVRWHLSRGRSFAGEDMRPRRTLGVSFDITERKQAEELLRDADRRKNDFLATLAHELRNPLAPIRNAVQVLMLKGPPHPELQWARALIARQAQQLTRLVDDLLDISRITQNKLELRREVVTLSDVVSAAVETSRPLIDEGGHELTLSQSPEPVFVDADPTRLAQVVSNLLNNAAKYSEPNSAIMLTIDREGSDAVVRVRDSGAGIPPEMLPRIFEMFVQLDRSTSRTAGGLGVGLALAKQLVEMHDGHIDVRSEGAGRGSEFVVRLPTATRPSVEVREEAPSEPSTRTTPLRVVVADDNRDSVDSLALLLRLTGNDVQEAYDGQQAVDAVRDFRPHVVLLDIGMPKLNGYEAARFIRGQAWGVHPVLVALTGWGQDTDRRQSREAGFDHHLVKPVEPSTLMKLLADVGTVAHSTPVGSHIAYPVANVSGALPSEGRDS